jgi:hypothetical protein
MAPDRLRRDATTGQAFAPTRRFRTELAVHDGVSGKSSSVRGTSPEAPQEGGLPLSYFLELTNGDIYRYRGSMNNLGVDCFLLVQHNDK